MMHTRESLAAELRLLQDRPSAGGGAGAGAGAGAHAGADAGTHAGARTAPPVLSLFAVDVSGDGAAYEQRLRSVMSAAVRIGGSAESEQESLPVDGVPDWFVAACSGGEERAAPQFARAGRDRYMEHTGGGRPWELRDWLHRFGPDEDSRGWAWWDATRVGPSRVHIWVDTWGESFFGCQDLLWAAHVAGAVRVDGPTVHRSGVWSAERNATH